MILWDVEDTFFSLPVEGYRAICYIRVMEDFSYGGFCIIHPMCLFSSVIPDFWKCSLEPSGLYFFAELANKSWNQTLSRLFPCVLSAAHLLVLDSTLNIENISKLFCFKAFFSMRIQTVNFTSFFIMLLSSLRLLN